MHAEAHPASERRARSAIDSFYFSNTATKGIRLMLAAIATTLAALIAAAVVLVGARSVWAPSSAVGFGIPNTRPDDRRCDRGWPSWASATSAQA
ncbi:hypothetical protein SAMN05216483_6374 [Streptomyces sp. 2131.1]|uniref:hypothetical protein n=1 Tax=Streptomyces sp. 2131.1 TaxID=1855346 RepID=UPI0008995CA1|nr:hypothetical protein [Streptomyces sp. 2131.1]SEE48785.1 hypothetical protein SAMN05216483_6374 [Streptomyces sp. 2131.1]